MGGTKWARRGVLAAAAALAAALATVAAAATAMPVADGLDNPRGIDVGPAGHVLVAESLSGVTELRLKAKDVQAKGSVALANVVDVAVDAGWGRTYAITGGPIPDAPPEAVPLPSKLLRARPSGGYDVVADLAAYQATDPDAADLEGEPTTSNPNGLALLGGGRILVADAEGNDVLLVDERSGAIATVARLLPELVPWPAGAPFGPPPGTLVPAEAVPTSVTVGPDGGYYVTELKGFPFAPGTSRVWRIEPGSVDAVCDPSNPSAGACRTVGTGYSSLIDLAFGPDGTMYPLEIAKASLWSVEILGGPPIGALYSVQGGVKTELAPGTLLFTGGVAVGADGLYVTTGAVFGPDGGAVVRVDE